jgi:hypothetical protein
MADLLLSDATAYGSALAILHFAPLGVGSKTEREIFADARLLPGFFQKHAGTLSVLEAQALSIAISLVIRGLRGAQRKRELKEFRLACAEGVGSRRPPQRYEPDRPIAGDAHAEAIRQLLHEVDSCDQTSGSQASQS